jgi:hypothetical protein
MFMKQLIWVIPKKHHNLDIYVYIIDNQILTVFCLILMPTAFMD